jgi:hypothetical protein
MLSLGNPDKGERGYEPDGNATTDTCSSFVQEGLQAVSKTGYITMAIIIDFQANAIKYFRFLFLLFCLTFFLKINIRFQGDYSKLNSFFIKILKNK